MSRLTPTAILLLAALTGVAEPVSFSRDVLPILSENCLSCHGPDESHRKADLRLDTFEGATAENDGVRAVVPGDPSRSDLIARILSQDPDEVMPPPKSHKPRLKPEEIDENAIERALENAKQALMEKKAGPEAEELMALIQRSTAQLQLKRKRRHQA